METHVGYLVQPRTSLVVQVLEALKPDALNEIALGVTHRPFALALGSRPIQVIGYEFWN